MQLRLAGTLGDAQGAGRLGMAETVDTHQYEHVARAFGKVRNRALEIERRPFAPRIGHVGQPRSGLGHFVLDAQAPAPGKHGVDGDPVQPGRESAALFEVSQCSPSSDERFLGTVLGGFALAGETQAQPIDSRRELTIQVLEGGEITAGGGGDEFGRLSGIHCSCNLQHLNRPHCVPRLPFA